MKSSSSNKVQNNNNQEDDFDNNPSSNTSKEMKNNNNNNDKIDATRSKHSVTEQRRRSKINERFQILRDLIPNSEQKRDTASFLLEVIEYVQYLQERVQKYEGSYQSWSAEPTKLMPWQKHIQTLSSTTCSTTADYPIRRNSHWRVPNMGHPPAIRNDSGPAPSFPVRFDENVSIPPIINTAPQNSARSDHSGDVNCNLMDSQSVQGSIPVPIQEGDGTFSHPPLQGSLCNVNLQPTDIPADGDGDQQEELTVEGGTISISSVYSQGLLNSLTQALQNSGVDLTQATISVQVDLGKRANKGLSSGASTAKDHENPHSSNQPVGRFQDFSNRENSDQAQKRQKT